MIGALGCEVVQYVKLGSSFKVKIMEEDLKVALENGGKSGCSISLWVNDVERSSASPIGSTEMDVCDGSLLASAEIGTSMCADLRIACWNCRRVKG